jgi:retron-type reverse transcriptase
MSKDEGGWNSSLSEKPVRSRLRRLVDWINLTGAKKVHSLIDKVYKRKNLEMAWERVKANRGSGGVDGQNLEAFEAQLEQQLDRLQRELKEGTYQPLPVRQHPIPKRDKPGSLAVAAQDSRPSGSLLLSCKALSSSTSCRFIPAH